MPISNLKIKKNYVLLNKRPLNLLGCNKRHNQWDNRKACDTNKICDTVVNKCLTPWFNTKIRREFINRSRVLELSVLDVREKFWRTIIQSKLAKGSENYTFWPANTDFIKNMLSWVAVPTSRSVLAGVVVSTLLLKMYKRNARKCDHTLRRSRSKHRSGKTILRRQGRVDNLLKVMFWRLINRVFVFVTTLLQRSRDCLNFL